MGAIASQITSLTIVYSDADQRKHQSSATKNNSTLTRSKVILTQSGLKYFKSYGVNLWYNLRINMMTSSNGNIFRVTGILCGEFTGPDEFPTQRPVTPSFDVFFDLRLNKRLSKQPRGWWFETQSWSLWRHRNEYKAGIYLVDEFKTLIKSLDCPNCVSSVCDFYWYTSQIAILYTCFISIYICVRMCIYG